MPTLFVEADEPLLVFPSVEVAEGYLEAEDVRYGVYPRAFDASGRQFSISAEGNLVRIEPIDAPEDPDGLAALLRSSLSAVGQPASNEITLPDLVAAAEAFWNERDPVGDRFSKPIPWWGCLLVIAGMVAIVAYVWR